MYFYYDSIDNDTISSNKLYGHLLGYDSIDSKYKIYKEEDSLDNLDYNTIEGGSYTLVSIDNKDNSIKINQDLCGCRQLYYIVIPYSNSNISIIDNYYNNDTINTNGIIAISDSFFTLVEKVKELIDKYNIDYNLTINENFVYASFAASELCPCVKDTLITEIHIFPINSEIVINGNTITINKDPKNYIENHYMIHPLSEEGMKIMDDWFTKWTRIFEDIFTQYNTFIDLSGGLDTRIMLAMLKNTNLDISTIKFSAHTKLTGRKNAEDYEISEEIRNDENISPLQAYPITKIKSDEDISFDLAKYSSLGTTLFTKVSYIHYLNRQVKIGGLFSDIKGLWHTTSKEEIIEKFTRNLKDIGIDYIYMEDTSILTETETKVYKYILDNIDSILSDNNYNTNHIGSYIYKRVNNNIRDAHKMKDFSVRCPYISPFMGSQDLIRLDFNPYKDTEESDYSLIATYLLYKYAPELLKYPIQGDREFKESTIQKLKDLNITQKNNENGTIPAYSCEEERLIVSENKHFMQDKITESINNLTDSKYERIISYTNDWISKNNVYNLNGKYTPYILISINELLKYIN